MDAAVAVAGPGGHDQYEATGHFCCGQPPRHGFWTIWKSLGKCWKWTVTFSALKHMGSSIWAAAFYSICPFNMEFNSRLRLFAPWFLPTFIPSLRECVTATRWNTHLETQVVSILVYQVLIKLTHLKWVLHQWHRLAFTPLRPQRHTRICVVCQPRTDFCRGEGTPVDGKSLQVMWDAGSRSEIKGFTLVPSHMIPHERKKLLGCDMMWPNLTRCMRRAWAGKTRKDHKKVNLIGESDMGVWCDFEWF